MTRHIVDGRLTPYAAHVNRKIDRAIRERLACATCGRKFGPRREPADTDPTICRECKEAL